jgi:small conductance mechanosensitive channel
MMAKQMGEWRQDRADHAGIGDRAGRDLLPALRRRKAPWALIALTGLALVLSLVSATFLPPALAQDSGTSAVIETVVPDAQEKVPDVPVQVDVEPEAADEHIAERLTNILLATGWFQASRVTVHEGVVFLEGRTRQQQYKDWAGELAGKTQDVVAVVNRIEVVQRSPWDFSPALDEVRRLARGSIQALPQIGFGLLILVFTWFLAKLAVRIARRLLARSVQNPLLRDVGARLCSLPVLILGVYLILQFFGLTRLALTVLGGTGLAGLAIGIAFSDIVENFLASILISMRQPFLTGDFVQLAGHSGVVQRVTTRGTVLMGADGNHIQIPNATVYKSNIVNYTANPNRRIDFAVGIGYDAAIADAQELVLEVLADHPAVLRQPEPLVLAEKLGPSTVDLRIYFWIDSSKHNVLKVKSSIIRLTKGALQQAGFSIPDPAREVIFPQGIPLPATRARPPRGPGQPARPRASEPATVSTPAEGALASEDETIREQGRKARVPEDGRNLLEK